MIPSPILQALQQKPEFDIYSNPYRAKRSWPPDFAKLSPKHQFRLERRYKRRVKLKWARPRWTKAVKLMQFGSVVGITVYGVLFLDWKQENQPFQGIRKWFGSVTGLALTRLPERGKGRQSEDASPASNTPATNTK